MKKVELKVTKQNGVDCISYDLVTTDVYDDKISDKVKGMSNIIPFQFSTDENGISSITSYANYETTVDVYTKNILNKKSVLGLISGIINAYEIGQSGVPISYLVKEPKYIYIDSNNMLKFMVLPIKQDAMALADIPCLFRDILCNMRFDDKDEDNYVACMLTLLNSNDFTLSKLKEFVENQLEKMGLFYSKESGLRHLSEQNIEANTVNNNVKVNKIGVMNNIQNANRQNNQFGGMMGAPMGMPAGMQPNGQMNPPMGQPMGAPMGQSMGMPTGMQPNGQMNPPMGAQMGQSMGMPTGMQPNGQMNPPMGQPMGAPMGMPTGMQPNGQMNPPMGQPMGAPMGMPAGMQPNGQMNPPMGQPMGAPMGMPAGMQPNGQGNQQSNPSMGQPMGAPMGMPAGMQPNPQMPQPQKDATKEEKTESQVPNLLGLSEEQKNNTRREINLDLASEEESATENSKVVENVDNAKNEEVNNEEISNEEVKSEEINNEEVKEDSQNKMNLNDVPDAVEIKTSEIDSNPQNINKMTVSQPGDNMANITDNIPNLGETEEIKETVAFAPNSEAETPVMGNTQGLIMGQLNVKPIPHIIRKRTSEVINITKSPFKIGKSKINADYTIENNTAISRVHCTIIQKNGVNYITDNGSTNKTYVNGVLLEEGNEVLLKNRTTIQMGDEEFTFLLRKGE